MTDTARLAAQLRATGDAVRASGWVAPGLGAPSAPLDLLGSTHDPLAGLDAAGLGWFRPLVSFLGEPLTRLRGGNGASVVLGSRDFADAGADVADVAEAYRTSTSAQTSEWSGAAASGYRQAAARHAAGVAGLGQASDLVGGAIIGAGQVVAQAIAEVTELISAAVARIVPILTQAVARAAETFGRSVVEAIPPCVGIAVEHATRIAATLAALLASGENLLKLVRGGMAAVDLIQQALSGISRQGLGADAVTGLVAAADPRRGGGLADAVHTVAASDSAATGSSAPASSAGGYGGSAMSGGSVAPQGTHSWTPPASPVAGAVEPAHTTLPDASRIPGQLGGSGASATPGGGGRAGGGASGADAEPARPDANGVPLGGLGGRGVGDTDTEHRRAYRLDDTHEAFEPADPWPDAEGTVA